VEVGRAGLQGPIAVVLAAVALLLQVRGVSAAWLMLGGAVLGLASALG
jgi:hypothetical protein